MPDVTLIRLIRPANLLKLRVFVGQVRVHATSDILIMTPDGSFRAPTLHHPMQRFRLQFS
ncbi:Uncharacterised protein [Escherichia albertii]|nr:Uncharacterised protein [Escherichia coli]